MVYQHTIHNTPPSGYPSTCFIGPHRSPPSIPVAFMVPRLHVGTSPCRQLSFAGIATIASSTIPVPTIATLVQFQCFWISAMFVICTNTSTVMCTATFKSTLSNSWNWASLSSLRVSCPLSFSVFFYTLQPNFDQEPAKMPLKIWPQIKHMTSHRKQQDSRNILFLYPQIRTSRSTSWKNKI